MGIPMWKEPVSSTQYVTKQDLLNPTVSRRSAIRRSRARLNRNDDDSTSSSSSTPSSRTRALAAALTRVSAEHNVILARSQVDAIRSRSEVNASTNQQGEGSSQMFQDLFAQHARSRALLDRASSEYNRAIVDVHRVTDRQDIPQLNSSRTASNDENPLSGAGDEEDDWDWDLHRYSNDNNEDHNETTGSTNRSDNRYASSNSTTAPTRFTAPRALYSTHLAPERLHEYHAEQRRLSTMRMARELRRSESAPRSPIFFTSESSSTFNNDNNDSLSSRSPILEARRRISTPPRGPSDNDRLSTAHDSFLSNRRELDSATQLEVIERSLNRIRERNRLRRSQGDPPPASARSVYDLSPRDMRPTEDEHSQYPYLYRYSRRANLAASRRQPASSIAHANSSPRIDGLGDRNRSLSPEILHTPASSVSPPHPSSSQTPLSTTVANDTTALTTQPTLTGSRTFSSLYDMYHQNNNSVNDLTTTINNNDNESPSTTTIATQDTTATSNINRNDPIHDTNEGTVFTFTSAANDLFNPTRLSDEALEALRGRYVCDLEEFEDGNEEGEGEQIRGRTGQGREEEDGRDGLSIE